MVRSIPSKKMPYNKWTRPGDPFIIAVSRNISRINTRDDTHVTNVNNTKTVANSPRDNGNQLIYMSDLWGLNSR